MTLSGEFGAVAFAEVIQLCARIRSSGALQVTSGAGEQVVGQFFFEHGNLVDAQLGNLEGEEAFRRALELTTGSYHFELGLRARERRIFTSVEKLLLGGGLDVTDENVEGGVDDQGELEEEAAGAAVQGSSAVLAAVSNIQRRDTSRRLVAVRDDRDDDDEPPLSVIPARPIPPPPAAPAPAVSEPTRLRVGILLVVAALGLMVVTIWVIRLANAPQAGTSPAPETAAENASETAPSPAVAPAAPAAPAVVALAPTSAVSGVTEHEIRFGMVAPFSGPARELGRQMKVGVEAAFNAANEAGGIHDRRLSLLTVDDGYEPGRTVEAMKDLRDGKKVFGFIGNVGTPTAAVALPLALEKKMPFLGAFTGANLLRREPPDRYVFNFRASYAEETAAVVRYLIKVRHLRADSIVVFAQQDAFGDAGYSGVVRAMREIKPDMHAPVRLGYQRNTTDVAEAMAGLSQRHRTVPVKAVVMVATYRAAARFIEQAHDLYPKVIFTNVSFVGSTALAEELRLLGQRYATGVIVTQVVPPVESFATAVLKYKEVLRKYFPGEKPDYVSLEGYWMANLMIEGVRRAGREIDSEHLVDALESIHDLDLGLGAPLSFGLGEHQASHRVWGTQINDAGTFDVIDLK